jgi:hypothetical protein
VRAEVGDTIKIVFKNNLTFHASLHPPSSTRRNPKARRTATAWTRRRSRHVSGHLKAGMQALYKVEPKPARSPTSTP